MKPSYLWTFDISLSFGDYRRVLPYPAFVCMCVCLYVYMRVMHVCSVCMYMYMCVRACAHLLTCVSALVGHS